MTKLRQHQNGLPEPDDESYEADEADDTTADSYESDSSSGTQSSQLSLPTRPPADEPVPPPHRRVGAFRLAWNKELKPDTSVFGTPSTLIAPPSTVPRGVAFVEKKFRGLDQSGATPGLGYKYYEGSWEVLPDFRTLTPVAAGTADNFDIGVRLRDSNYGLVFYGEIKIPVAGTYVFYTTSDDGSALWIGETLVVNNDALHATQEQSGSIALSAGRHAVTLAFFQGPGAAALEVSWQGPSFGKQRIPATALFRGDAMFADAEHGPLLRATPGNFRLLGQAHRQWPFFYEDARRSFFVEPRTEGVPIHEHLLEDAAAVLVIETVRSRGLLATDVKWRFWPLYHPYSDVLVRELAARGLQGLFDRRVQSAPAGLVLAPRVLNFSDDYLPSDTLVNSNHYPVEEIEFAADGAYAQYNWELFFHAPLFIAERLFENQRFAEAQKWFHCIFDPTSRAVSDSGADRYWTFRGFQATQQRSIDGLLRLIDGDDHQQRELSRQVERWRKNPFDPHAVASLRTTAYQMAVVMKYVDNLVAWGDQLFRADTMESVNQATLLYVLAADLLGPRPQTIDRHREAQPKTFAELATSTEDDLLVRLENVVDLKRQARGDREHDPLTAPYYFCTPQNDKLLSYWDTVADRLFKVRHCMNIEGIQRQLALFEPPIEPDLLVRAAAAGVDLVNVLADTAGVRIPYRFGTTLSVAKEFCADVKALGNALLSALEKRDSEQLSLLRTGHEVMLLNAAREVRKRQVAEARESLASVQLSREAADTRYQHYRDIARMNNNEREQLANLDTAFFWQQVAQVINSAASVAHISPDIDLGISGWAGSPVVKLRWGGTNVGSALSATAGVASFIAAIFSHRSTVAGIKAGWDRRWDDWKLQEKLASKEREQLDRQIAAAEIRLQIAEKELANHDLQVENAQEAQTFMQTKFTNRELYDWMVSQISALYFQVYQLAFDTAKRAQRAYQYELGTSETFVQFGYWDNLKKGLLAGERLHHDLKRMEAAHLEKNRREHEITKHVSLALLDPVALVMLRHTGECFVDLPEALFDRDYPGHYFRRLKAVSVSVPCVSGPYTSVNCTLTLLSNTLRRSAALHNGLYLRAHGPNGEVMDDERFADGVGAIQSIVTSTGRDDSGLFEQNLRDERYLPFEGAGAVSRWRLQLPKETNRFDFDSITDVVLHLRYTARDGGEVFKQAAWDAVVAASPQQGARLFVARQEFPDAWHRFASSAPGAAPALAMDLVADRFPFQPAGRQLRVTEVELFAAFAASAPRVAGTLTAPDGQTYGFEWPTNAELRHARVELPSGGLAPGLFRLALAAGSALPSDLAVVCHYESVANG